MTTSKNIFFYEPFNGWLLNHEVFANKKVEFTATARLGDLRHFSSGMLEDDEKVITGDVYILIRSESTQLDSSFGLDANTYSTEKYAQYFLDTITELGYKLAAITYSGKEEEAQFDEKKE